MLFTDNEKEDFTFYFYHQLVHFDSQICFLYFGSETKGLSTEFQQLFTTIHGQYLTIPMAQNCRCLNLSNSVAIIGYEVYRQYRVCVSSTTTINL